MTDPTELTNICVMLTDLHLGDVCLLLPALRALRSHYNSARLTLVAAPYNLELVNYLHLADEVMLCNWEHEAEFRAALAQKHFDGAFNFSPKKESGRLIKATKAPLRYGFNYRGRWLQTWRARCYYNKLILIDEDQLDRKHNIIPHEVRHYLDLLKAYTGVTVDDKDADNGLLLTPEVSQFFTSDFPRWCPGRLRGLHLHNNWTGSLNWSLEQLADLVQGMLTKAEHVVLTSGEAEAGLREQLCALLKRRALKQADFPLNLPGRTSASHQALDQIPILLANSLPIPWLLGLLHQMEWLVSPDTGVPHLAASQHTPTVVLYPGPKGHRVIRRFAPWHNKCLPIMGLAPQLNLDQILRMLNQ